MYGLIPILWTINIKYLKDYFSHIHTDTLMCTVQSFSLPVTFSHLSPFQTVNSSKLWMVQITTMVPLTPRWRKLIVLSKSKIFFNVDILWFPSTCRSSWRQVHSLARLHDSCLISTFLGYQQMIMGEDPWMDSTSICYWKISLLVVVPKSWTTNHYNH